MKEVITSTNLTAADAPLWNTAEHHGSVVSVVTWLLIIATVFMMLARVVTRFATMKKLRWDDILAIFAMVRTFGPQSLCHRRGLGLMTTNESHASQITAIGQSIAVSYSSTHGLGTLADRTSPDQRDVIQKVCVSLPQHKAAAQRHHVGLIR